MGVELAQQRYGELTEMEDVDITDRELVYHVRNTLVAVQLDNKTSHESDSYNQLWRIMLPSGRLAPDQVALLVTTLKALSGTVTYIDINCHHFLLNSIFGMRMWNYGPDVMDALVELITSLATSNGKYVDSCLDMLVSNFTPPASLVDMLKQPRGQAKKEQVLTRVHLALEAIVDRMPMAALKLSSIVVHKMPRPIRMSIEKDLKYRAEIYLKNMLMLESGAIREFVGRSMLMAVMDMLIEFDVSIGWDDILRDDSCKGIFAMELEDEDEAIDDDDSELPRTLSLKSLDKNVTADLLDSLVMQTFEHLESCASKKRLSEVFETLLDSFMLTILNTYKSKFAQFVLFYGCALDSKNCGEKFAKMLAERFVCGDNPLSRMSAVAYLASYLARGKFLSAGFVFSMLERLVDWCFKYCKIQDGDMNPKAHQIFYSACQAIMYVLCFHMKSMMEVPRFKSQLLHMPLESILKHKLEPLKVCLPSIVKEFLKQAKAAHLFSFSETSIFDDLLESDHSKDFGGLERLDMFFPFDPCLLKNCDRNFIRPHFVHWKDVRTTYGGDEDSSDEDIAEDFDGEEGENFMEEGMARSFDGQDLVLDEFDFAMNKMSITPKNTSNYRLGSERMQMPSRIRPSTSPESL